MKRRTCVITVTVMLVSVLAFLAECRAEELDPYTVMEVFCRFPNARVIPLDGGEAWGLLYADTYGKLHLLRATSKGWKLEWELTSLGSKIRKFFFTDLDGDGSNDFVVATINGRILSYDAENFVNTWENLEDKFQVIMAIEIENIDNDPQPELIILADSYLHVFDGKSKSRQWTSDRKFEATELIVENVDKDDQFEIILNTGVIIDSKFKTIELEWDKPFGERITVFDMNNDGYPEVIGEFSDYSLRIFDVYTRREVW